MTTTSDATDSTKDELGFAFWERGALPDIQPLLCWIARGDTAAADAASAMTVRLWDEAERATSDEQRNRTLALRHELQWALATMESADPRVLAAKARIVECLFFAGEPPFLDELTGTLARGLEQLAEQSRHEHGAARAELAEASADA